MGTSVHIPKAGVVTRETWLAPLGGAMSGATQTNRPGKAVVHEFETITTGLQWKLVQKPLTIVGELTNDDRDACWELGAAVAAGLAP